MPHSSHGMTLIEVVVALAILSVMSVLAWRGYAQLRQAQTLIEQQLEQHQRLEAALTQWSQDLASMQAMADRASLAFDGQRLSLIRRTPTGFQVVHWALKPDDSGKRYLTRLAWPATTDPALLDTAWRAPSSPTDQAMRLFEAQDWQLRYFRNNSWSHPLSSGDVRSDAAPSTAGSSQTPSAGRTIWPRAIRLVISLPTHSQAQTPSLQRDVLLPPDEP